MDQEPQQPPKPPAPPVANANIAPGVNQPMPADLITVCATCGSAVPKYYTFCPNCGKSLNAKPLSTSTFTMIWMYGVSVFLPPLGLWPGIKYFKSEDPKAQRIGMIAILLTIASTLITVWLSYALVQNYVNQLNGILQGTGITPQQATGGLF
ncbi:MAG TPA: zinc ribbon domain-containing protein [Candidatus Paceibacterota bacterium]|nr:zinc ribbon domain-containing protein [Candidatus Paceibacterota bacterium]